MSENENNSQENAQSSQNNNFQQTNSNEQNPQGVNSSSKNNRRHKFKKRKKSLENSVGDEQNSNFKATKNQNKEENEHPEKSKKKKNRNLPSKLKGDEPWQVEMHRVIEANKRIQHERLYPLEHANDGTYKIRITPIGGLGEVGGNMTVIETQNEAIIVDIGLSFPDSAMLAWIL